MDSIPEGLQIRGRNRELPLESTAGVEPLSREEIYDFEWEDLQCRERWRLACEANLRDLRRAYPRGIPKCSSP